MSSEARPQSGAAATWILADAVVPQSTLPQLLPAQDDDLGAAGPLADELRIFARFCRSNTVTPPPGTAFQDGVAVVKLLDQIKKVQIAIEIVMKRLWGKTMILS